MDYTGLKCPVCGKTFTANDDIVVCPDCGAPYHRECYAKVGKCVFADRHGTPDAWKRPPEEPGPESQPGQRCPRCGSQNAPGALFCAHCGQPLAENQQDFHGFPQNNGFPFAGGPQNGPPFPPYQQPQQNGAPGQIPFLFDPLGGVNPNEPIEDVPAGDAAKLVQNNTQYYLPVFMNLTHFHRNRFNFGAFLFSAGWLLYRKMYKLGGILAAAMAALYLAFTYITINYSQPIMQVLYASVGITSDTASPNYNQIVKMADLLLQMPAGKIILFFIPTVISAINLTIMIVVGINANKWYLRHCVDKARTIQASAQSPTEREIRFQEQGGVNTGLAICLLVCYMIVMYISAL